MSITKEADSTFISKFSIAASLSFVFWIDASSVGTITQGLKDIRKAIWPIRPDESTLDWIGSLKENYIMVFDNADHQGKPHLLICGNKFRSALVSRRQADFDQPTGISSSQ